MQQSFVSTSVASLGWGSQFRIGDQHEIFHTITPVQLKEIKEIESQCVRDVEGRALREKKRTREK